MILRAPTAWLTALQAFMAANTSNPATQVSLSSIKPPLQSGNSNASQFPASGIAAAISPGSQLITTPGYGQCVLTIPSAVVRALAGAAAGSMPSEALQLSPECCVDAQAGWPTVFQSLGFTSFAATVLPVPIMAC